MNYLQKCIEKYSTVYMTAITAMGEKRQKLGSLRESQKKAKTIGSNRRAVKLKKEGDILEYQLGCDQVLFTGVKQMRKDLKRIKESSLIEFLTDKNQWSIDTFGDGERVDTILAHITKELEEVRDKPKDLFEWVDIILLALDGPHRQGYTPEQVFDALLKKQEINKAREWPPIDSVEDGKPIEHLEVG